MAAPLKLEDPKLRKALLAKIRNGYRIIDACESNDIDYSTFRRWMRDGEPPENPEEDPLAKPRSRRRGPVGDTERREYDTLTLKRQFFHAVEKANAEYRAKLDEKLRDKADGNFRDLLTYAKIRFPDQYREPVVAPTVQVNASTQTGNVELTFAEIAASAIADAGDQEENT